LMLYWRRNIFRFQDKMKQTLRQDTGPNYYIEGIDIPATVFSDRNALPTSAVESAK